MIERAILDGYMAKEAAFGDLKRTFSQWGSRMGELAKFPGRFAGDNAYGGRLGLGTAAPPGTSHPATLRQRAGRKAGDIAEGVIGGASGRLEEVMKDKTEELRKQWEPVLRTAGYGMAGLAGIQGLSQLAQTFAAFRQSALLRKLLQQRYLTPQRRLMRQRQVYRMTD